MRSTVAAVACAWILSSPVPKLVAQGPLAPPRSAVAGTQNPARGDSVQGNRFTLLPNWDRNPKTLQELNDLAAMGYRVVFASPSDLLLERRPRNETTDDIHYLFRSRPIAEFQSEVNELIAQGSRVVLQIGLTTLIEAPSGAETPTSARRPAIDASRYEYQLITTARQKGRDLSSQEFEERLSHAVNEGFRVVNMVTVQTEEGGTDRSVSKSRVVLMRRVIGSERDRPRAAVSVEVKWVKASKRNLNKYSSQGYRLRHIGWGVGGANGDLLFEKAADSTERPEYAVAEFWNSTPERALNELASRGFRLIRHGEIGSSCCSRALSGVNTLIMEKLPSAESVEYRVMDLATLNTATNQGAIEEAVVGVIRLRGRLWDRVTSTLVVLERPLGR